MFSDKIVNIPEKRKKNFESGFHFKATEDRK